MIKKFYHLIDIREDFNPKKKWAVFIDRDGVINEERHLVHKIKDFVIYPFAFKALKIFNQYKIPTIIHHNASVVARGLCPLSQIVKLNQYMKKEFAKKKVFADLILFCPHHPTAYNPKYKFDCPWRKPRPGMLTFPARVYNFNLKKSYVIGDAARDILMGQKVNAKTLLVKTGHAGKDPVHKAKIDIVVKDILEAAKYIVRKNIKNKE